MKDITVFSHLDCIAKDNGEKHPETKERLEVILDSIKGISQLNISFKDSPLADFKTINLVHPQSYIDDLAFNDSNLWACWCRKRALC